MVTVSGYIETKTGNYVCMQCGEVFTKEETERLEKKNIDMQIILNIRFGINKNQCYKLKLNQL